ncbi:MAG TPA: RDD family protein [Usitatibacter sp.]|nr:RDD family protein [Usitatibacter sp.]
MQTAGVGLRALAVIVDSLILMFLGYLLAKMTGQTTGGGFNLEGGPAFLWFLIALAYYVVMEVTQGGTIGKKAMGLRVVRMDGRALDWQAGLIRNLLRLIDGLPAFYLVGAIVIWVSKSKQRLGDMAAKTLVVKKDSVPVPES